MSNKNGLSFVGRLWLFVIIVCVLFVGLALINFILTLAPIIVATCIFTAGIIIVAAIISQTIIKVFGKNNDDETK